MILPSKYLPADRSLIVVGGEVIAMLKDSPLTVSETWERMSRVQRRSPLGFDWFVLAITLLFIIGMVDLRDGLLVLQGAT
ncbi:MULTISPECIES: ABC-three component system middle component 6 [unclassified Sinorhizobium]|uniref:ABC-three component system middle component 6 n=1 Tax=unclassified Sinorhizobium TaxID=2613772 RepID=UPI0035261C8C